MMGMETPYTPNIMKIDASHIMGIDTPEMASMEMPRPEMDNTMEMQFKNSAEMP